MVFSGKCAATRTRHFDTMVEGKALRVTLSGNAYYRFFTP